MTFYKYSLDISYMDTSYQDLSQLTMTLDFVTLTLGFDLLLKNFNLADISCPFTHTALIFDTWKPPTKTYHI